MSKNFTSRRFATEFRRVAWVIFSATLTVVALLAGSTNAQAETIAISSYYQVVPKGNYVLQIVDHEGSMTRFHINFGGSYELVVVNNILQVKDFSGTVVDSVAPTIMTATGQTITGTFEVQSPQDFAFVEDSPAAQISQYGEHGHHRMKRWSGWGSFWCSAAATVSGTVGGAFLGGPLGAGFGLGTGLAAAATC